MTNVNEFNSTLATDSFSSSIETIAIHTRALQNVLCSGLDCSTELLILNTWAGLSSQSWLASRITISYHQLNVSMLYAILLVDYSGGVVVAIEIVCQSQ